MLLLMILCIGLGGFIAYRLDLLRWFKSKIKEKNDD
jgi:hypothetical protein